MVRSGETIGRIGGGGGSGGWSALAIDSFMLEFLHRSTGECVGFSVSRDVATPKYYVRDAAFVSAVK